jgi:alpha-L-rhamnosidase
VRAVALVAAVLVLGGVPAAAAGGPGPPDHLTVDGLTSPVGVDDTPAFAWRVDDDRRGAVQAAYRVVVAGAADGRGVVWDSGRVASDQQAFVPYRGPALAGDRSYWWTVTTWSAGGQASPPAPWQRFDTGLHDGDWRADWVRRIPADSVDALDEYTFARAERSLPRSPIVRAVAYVSADQQYQLWVNGVKAAAGPALGYPDSQHYEATDVSRLLRPGGANAVGLLYHWNGVGKGRPAGAPGVIAELSIGHADGSHELLVTDGTWRVTRAPWLPSTPRNEEGDPVDSTEHVNGAGWPTGWDQPGFDDRLWQPAVVIGRPPVAPWTHLAWQRTRIVEAPVAAKRLTVLASGAVVADFGAVVAASPAVTFHQGVPGRAVTMHAGYLLDQLGQVSTTAGTQHTDMSYAYVQALGRQTFRAFDYLGFRYLQIDDPGEALAPADVVAWARHAAVPDEAGASFSSSDPTVDAVFGLARHSALFGSQEQFIDTPTREKGPFLRDGFNISSTAMRAFGEQNLTRRALLEFAQSQARYWAGQGRLNAIYPSGQGKRDIPDFTEIYPEWVWQDWLATGDRDLLAAVYPVLVNIAAYVAGSIDGRTGLVTNLPGGDGDYQYGIVDWPMNMRYGYDMATTARTTVNVLAADVFDRVGRVASALGRPGPEVAVQGQRRAALVAAINARLRRPDGVYVDGLHADGSRSSHASQHANAYAIAYGVAPDGAAVAAAGARAAALGMSMGPQTAAVLLAALHDAGRDGDLVRVLTDRRRDGWANVLARGGTFTWETWEPSDSNGDSMSHGWGSTVLVAIQEALLGVTPTGPGFATATVAVPAGGLGSLSRASGTVPTVRGPITVSWSRPTTAGGGFDLDVSLPANSSAVVAVPATSAGAVSEGGRPLAAVPGVRSFRQQGQVVLVDVGAGSYRFGSRSVPAAYLAAEPRRAAKAVAGGGGAAPSALPPAAGAGSSTTATSAAAARGGPLAVPAGARHHRDRWPWPLAAAVALAVVAVGLVPFRPRAGGGQRRAAG